VNDEECFLCNSEDVVYVDVLGFGWCRHHYDEEFSNPKYQRKEER
jgi:hypothetical protein